MIYLYKLSTGNTIINVDSLSKIRKDSWDAAIKCNIIYETNIKLIMKDPNMIHAEQ